MDAPAENLAWAATSCIASDSSEDFDTQAEATDWIAENGCEAFRCNPEQGLVDAVESAAALAPDAAAALLAQLLETSGGAMWFNATRNAIQAAGCGAGTVNLHVPLAPEVGARLRAFPRHTRPLGARGA